MDHPVHITSAPFTPAQNGFIERENRTVLELTRTMLFAKQLPLKLWGEAANAAVYLLNRSIYKSRTESTPFELYHKIKPRASHLRVFGSVAFMKIQEKKRSGYQKKLEPRAVKMIMVGYAATDFTYRLFDPVSNKVVISREVSFDENKLWEFTHEKNPYSQLELLIDATPVGDDDSDVDEIADNNHDDNREIDNEPQQSIDHRSDESRRPQSFHSADDPPIEEQASEVPPRSSSLDQSSQNTIL